MSFFTTLNAQPEDPPPDDGGFYELDVPITGGDIFYIVALGIGGVLIYRQQSKKLVPVNKRRV